MEYAKKAQEIIDIELEAVRKVRDGLGLEFGRSVNAILDSLNGGGKIVVTGLGKSLHIGQKIAATLTSTGSPAVILHPAEAMHGDMGILQKGDVVLALSYTGASDELLNLLPILRGFEVRLITLTGDLESALAKDSDEVIPITIDREACPLNISPTSSTTAMLAVGDALAMVLLQARGFSRDDYAKLHPGGAIGRALLYRIRDIMRTGKRVAYIRTGARVRDAMLAMTEARAGSVVVVDEHHAVLGIFTDGDLRRHMMTEEQVMARRIEDVMTANPITLQEDQLAVDVVAIFREHRIDDLIIVDDKQHLAGMVDIQDLPKFKLV